MGKIGKEESFAELSILKEEPMSYSIITATDVVLGTISAINLFSLDQTMLDLLLQSCQPTGSEMTQVSDRCHSISRQCGKIGRASCRERV